MVGLALDVLATDQIFDETAYLAANLDVSAAVHAGAFADGWSHFDAHGRREGRHMRVDGSMSDMRMQKLKRYRHLLRQDMPFTEKEGKYNYLSDALREEMRIIDTDAVSAHPYDWNALNLIESLSDGVVLDCGAGKRPVYYDNVVNYEIVDYDTTDIVGVGEVLPFVGGSFDAVISNAVLEHVRDPFRCAKEIVRVLKPGGRLLCAVPFLQPEHGYPHHYYNMAPQGLRALFEDELHIDDHQVVDATRPIWTLTWFLDSWLAGLPSADAESMRSLTVGELLSLDRSKILDQPWVRNLPNSKNFELACGTVLFAHKPTASADR